MAGAAPDYSGVVNTAGDLSALSGWPDTSTLLQRLYDARNTVTATKSSARGEQYTSNRTEAFNAIQCTDGDFPRDLVINNRYDPSTPLHGARDGAAELARARCG